LARSVLTPSQTVIHATNTVEEDLLDHQDVTFVHSLNFIKGVGQVDDEVLETLWSRTNKVAGTTRAMSKSH